VSTALLDTIATVLQPLEPPTNAMVDTTVLEQRRTRREKTPPTLSTLLQWVTTLLKVLLSKSSVLLATSQIQRRRLLVPLVQQAISVTPQECPPQRYVQLATIVR